MEVEQKISNFIKKRLEKFASFQDEDHQTNPGKGNFSSPSSPKHLQNQNLPQKTSSTYQSTSKFSENPADELIYSASMDNNIQGVQVPFSRKGFRRSSTDVDEYYGKNQWRGDTMNNFESLDKVANISEREYRRSFSGPVALIQRPEEMVFQSSASGLQNYGKKLIGSPKMEGGMEFQRPVSDLNGSPKNTSTRGQNEWIDSQRRREAMERMHILETNKGAELSRAHQIYYDPRGWGGGPQEKQEMEIKQFLPGRGVQYIGPPKVQQDERKIMHNIEANKIGGLTRSPMYPTKEEWNGSPRKPEVKLEDTKKWVARSHVQEARGRVGPDIFDNRKYEIYVPTNEVHQSQRGKMYPQAQAELGDYRKQLKAPYMDAIEAAKLHGGVLIFDYSKNQQK